MLHRAPELSLERARKWKMDVILALKEVESKVVDLIHVAQGRNWWWTLLTL
jgi:hypothetical protein